MQFWRFGEKSTEHRKAQFRTCSDGICDVRIFCCPSNKCSLTLTPKISRALPMMLIRIKSDF